MEELFKEAENLYTRIDKIQLGLVKSRLDVCEEKKWRAISEMETAMCAVFQFLKCIIERKDNIVDLGKVWYNVNQEPDGTRNILIDSSNYLCNTSSIYVCDTISPLIYDGRWKHIVNKLNVKRWAYIEDLLPKGGE